MQKTNSMLQSLVFFSMCSKFEPLKLFGLFLNVFVINCNFVWQTNQLSKDGFSHSARFLGLKWLHFFAAKYPVQYLFLRSVKNMTIR